VPRAQHRAHEKSVSVMPARSPATRRPVVTTSLVASKTASVQRSRKPERDRISCLPGFLIESLQEAVRATKTGRKRGYRISKFSSARPGDVLSEIRSVHFGFSSFRVFAIHGAELVSRRVSWHQRRPASRDHESPKRPWHQRRPASRDHESPERRKPEKVSALPWIAVTRQ
jgi:hypothetical protein